MFSRVYYWAPANGNIGHSSMDIAFGAGPGFAEYVSWWPMQLGGDIWGGPGGFKNNYVDDRAEESGDATGVVDVTCLDEWAMKAYWDMWKQNNYYAVYSDNCAKAVADILYEGGAKFSVSCEKQYKYTTVWLPIDTYHFAQNIVSSASEIEQNRNDGVIPPSYLSDN
jgi:hypothetical protein